MLVIRQEQMAVFQKRAEQEFVVSVVKQLRNDHLDLVKDLPEDTLHKRVAYGVTRAREYGLTWENNLATFVLLMFTIAPHFDQFPVFHRYLTDENVPPDERMNLLLSKTTDPDWEAVWQASLPQDWPENLV